MKVFELMSRLGMCPAGSDVAIACQDDTQFALHISEVGVDDNGLIIISATEGNADGETQDG